ncbi:LAFE_0C01068g1_1 [Lachancea fermentati]|uniref:LAFE_0C01068g1_1 n=1 Tax=Lachancea fermentati TaxID=4955 RepID=A0A1G4M9B1_LACFM|nr:LAFE_0C01068g1_1 [Lachancea fermentati]
MGKAQSYIHLKPANLILKSTNKRNVAIASESHSRGNHTPMLRVHLEKFPSFIGHSSSRINRRFNEDTYSINMLKMPASGDEISCLRNEAIIDKEAYWRDMLPLKKSVLNLSIFDGHGGSRVSKLLANELHTELVNTFPSLERFYHILHEYSELVGGKYWSKIYNRREEYHRKFITSCNTKQEQVLFESGNSGARMIFDKWGNIIDKTSLLTENERLRLFLSYMKFDLEKCCGFNIEPGNTEDTVSNFPGGSTASSLFVTSYEEADSYDETFFVNPDGLLKLVVTQVGDTKIILCDKNGIAHSLTKVHHPSSSRESRRLGTDFQTDSFGDTRFLDNFANTRSFGDRVGKQEGLSCEPDIYSYLIGSTRLLPHSEMSKLQFGGDECFICLITDGVSDLMSDQELVDLITSTVNMRGLKNATPQFVSDEVIKFIAAIGGRHADNATCLVLRLPNWGNWPVMDRTGAIREEKLMSGASGSDRSDV